jgi:hypothetical protein
MPRDAASLELTHESFEQFWKALVSKRKARKLGIDIASAWRQLSDGGSGAAFLRAYAEAKTSKAQRKRAAESDEPRAAESDEPRAAESDEPRAAEGPAANVRGAAPAAAHKTTKNIRPVDKKRRVRTKGDATKRDARKAAAGTKRSARTKADDDNKKTRRR